MPSAITVRPAGPDEADVIGALTEDAYRADGYLDAAEADGYAAELRDAASRIRDADVLVAELDGEVVGCVTLAIAGTPWAETAGEGELEVRMLAVAASARRRGVAGALMAAAEDRARQLGLPRVVLCTGVSMLAAQRLYESLGFDRDPDRDWDPREFPLIGYARAVTAPAGS